MNLNDLKAQSAVVVADIRAIAVVTPGDYVAAGGELVRHVAARKKIVEKFAEPKKLAYAAHKAISALEAEFLGIVDKSERLIRSAMSEFKAAEARAIADEKAVLEAVARDREEDRQIEEAVRLHEAGDDAGAEAVLSAPVTTPTIVIEPTKAAGVSVRESWDWELVDVSKIDRRFLVPNEQAIRATVRSLGQDAESVVGGIRVRKTFTTTVRT
jgi:hypothetical protein